MPREISSGRIPSGECVMIGFILFNRQRMEDTFWEVTHHPTFRVIKRKIIWIFRFITRKTEDNLDPFCLDSYDCWIVKTDSIGNIEWQNTIGGSDWDWLYGIQQTSDGGYILGGNSWSDISGDMTENNFDTACISNCVMLNCSSDYWIIKTDATGNIQWRNAIGGNYDDWFYSIQQTAD